MHSTSNNPFHKFYKELNDQVKFPGRKKTTALLVKVKFRTTYQKLIALLLSPVHVKEKKNVDKKIDLIIKFCCCDMTTFV